VLLTEVKDWLAVISAAGVIVSFIGLNYLRGQFVTKDDHERSLNRLSETVSELKGRISQVEGDLEHMPDRDTSHRLEMAISRLEGKLETMDEKLKPIASISNRMQDLLLDGARK
jgi:hypothetical protein